MTPKENSIPKLIKHAKNKAERDYILQDNQKTRFGAKFIIITLILLIVAVIVTSYYIHWK